MGTVAVDMSMSLDGFVAGPSDDVEQLHEWMFNGDTRVDERSASVLPGREGFRLCGESAEVLDDYFESTGAFVMGRRWFDIGERLWGDNPPFRVPVFVVTHRARPGITKGETTFTFVTDGVESALRKAKSAAGDKNVLVGGANIAQQPLKAGLLDEVQIHLVPVLLGEGRRLFEDLGVESDLQTVRVIGPPASHTLDSV